jgi:hypothetical protein
MIASVPIRIIASYSEPLFVRINFTHETRQVQIFGNLHHRRSLAVRRNPTKELDHKVALIITTAATLAATAVFALASAEARGFGPGLAGGLIAGTVIGGIASNAYG